MKNVPVTYLLFLIFSLLALTKGKAQTVYTIPWAVQQPQWVFPIWFEDATGAKDTIYFAIDATATNSGIYESMGYKHSSIDTTVFHVYSIFGWLDTCKVLIANYGIAGEILSTRHVQYPLIVRWDKSLLNIEPNPSWNFDNNARLESNYIFANYPQPGNPPHNSVHLREIDSLYLPGGTVWGGLDANFPLNVFLSPVFETSIFNNNEKNKFKIANNPTLDFVMIAGDETFVVEIYDSKMTLIDSNKEWNTCKSISFVNMQQGIYFIFIHTQNQTYYEKIIKL